MVRAVFEKKYQSIWFWANLETFSRISPYQEFFSKNWLCHFSTFMQKIRKILWTVSEKTAVPTNQPTNQATNQPTNQPINQPTNQPTHYYQKHLSCRTLPVQNTFKQLLYSFSFFFFLIATYFFIVNIFFQINLKYIFKKIVLLIIK